MSREMRSHKEIFMRGCMGYDFKCKPKDRHPNYYSDWFFHRIKEGFLYVRNLMNPHQISKIDLSPEVVDCIVFWTKNPEPMIARLDELREYHSFCRHICQK